MQEKKEQKLIFRCDCEDCKHWEYDAGDWISDGGCELNEVIIEMQLTASGFHPMCRNYEEKTDD